MATCNVTENMKSQHPLPSPAFRRGFTLVELLVVILIVVVLAALSFTITRKVQQNAQATTRLSNIRQAGSMLLAMAAENNGRCSFFAGGNSGWDYRHYLMIRKELGMTNNNDLVEILHWDSRKLPPALPHWNCRAVNFQNVSYPDGTSTTWTQEAIKNNDGTTANVKSLSLASVAKPGSYPLLIDSSTAGGSEIFRINDSTGDWVGLRESGKAGAYLFDGSARLMDKDELKRAGFKKAYDNSKKPPVSITL
jgi:prepilin-type N-terminal cleavage/methylation domain-containing protein